jgi:hypothetical protein
MPKTETKQQDEIVINDDYQTTEVYASSTIDNSNWDELVAHKDWIDNNTVGLKTGHNNKSTYLVTRVPASVVKNAVCNQAHGDTPIDTIFTICMRRVRNDVVETKKFFTIGYGRATNGKRTAYQLTGSMAFNAIKGAYTVDVADMNRFRNVINTAAQSAQKQGTLDSEQFSNVLGRAKSTDKALIERKKRFEVVDLTGISEDTLF